MRILLDTNVLLRIADKSHSMHIEALELFKSGRPLIFSLDNGNGRMRLHGKVH